MLPGHVSPQDPPSCISTRMAAIAASSSSSPCRADTSTCLLEICPPCLGTRVPALPTSSSSSSQSLPISGSLPDVIEGYRSSSAGNVRLGGNNRPNKLQSVLAGWAATSGAVRLAPSNVCLGGNVRGVPSPVRPTRGGVGARGVGPFLRIGRFRATDRYVLWAGPVPFVGPIPKSKGFG